MKVFLPEEASKARAKGDHGRAARYDLFRWLCISAACVALLAVARWYLADSWSPRFFDVESLERTGRKHETIKADPDLTEPWSKVGLFTHLHALKKTHSIPCT